MTPSYNLFIIIFIFGVTYISKWWVQKCVYFRKTNNLIIETDLTKHILIDSENIYNFTDPKNRTVRPEKFSSFKSTGNDTTISSNDTDTKSGELKNPYKYYIRRKRDNTYRKPGGKLFKDRSNSKKRQTEDYKFNTLSMNVLREPSEEFYTTKKGSTFYPPFNFTTAMTITDLSVEK